MQRSLWIERGEAGWTGGGETSAEEEASVVGVRVLGEELRIVASSRERRALEREL